MAIDGIDGIDVNVDVGDIEASSCRAGVKAPKPAAGVRREGHPCGYETMGN